MAKTFQNYSHHQNHDYLKTNYYFMVDLQFDTVFILKISTPKNIEICKMTSKICAVTQKVVSLGVMTSNNFFLMKALGRGRRDGGEG